MRRNFAIGRKLGHIYAPDGMIIKPKEIDDYPDDEVCVICTGARASRCRRLRRMANNDHGQITLHSGDTVMFSASPVPGNERAVNETIDRLFHIGATVSRPRTLRSTLQVTATRRAEDDDQLDEAEVRDADPR